MVSKVNYGDVNIATPATHIVQLDSEQSYGTNILKGYDSGLLSFGQDSNGFVMINSDNQILGLEVQSWGYKYPFAGDLGPVTKNLYILCMGWIAFEIDSTNTPVWESWLTHFHPKPNQTIDEVGDYDTKAKSNIRNVPITNLVRDSDVPLTISMDASMCTTMIIDQISIILKSHPGDTEVRLQLKDGKKNTTLRLDEEFKVTYSLGLCDNLRNILGPDCLLGY